MCFYILIMNNYTLTFAFEQGFFVFSVRPHFIGKVFVAVFFGRCAYSVASVLYVLFSLFRVQDKINTSLIHVEFLG